MNKGELVAVHKRCSEPGKGLTYPSFTGTLLESCNGEGWGVVDVEHGLSHEIISVYAFSVRPILSPY